MSTLRLIGVLFGSIVLALSFLRLRSYTEKRTDTWLFIIFGIILIIISIFPDTVNLPADLISLGDQKGGRLITLLLISSALLWILFFYERSKNEIRHEKFDGWVRSSSVNEFLASQKNLLKPRSIFVLIPAYNEAKNLEKVLPRIPELICGQPVIKVVIDDGSIDETAEISQKFGALLVSQKINRGGGAALKVGFDIAKKILPSVIVTMDADGQHNPEEISTLVEPILKNEADFVIGSRILGSFDQDSQIRFYGVHVFSTLLNSMLGIHITDCSSGFRAFNKTVIDNCILKQEQYHTAELIIEAAKRGFRINERPIHIAKRLSGHSKKGKNIKYALFFLRTIIKSWLR